MRDYSLDYMKGIAVLLMLFVHPLMMMTNFDGNPDQAMLAGLASIVTQPIAGLFLFALGYAMAMKQRPMSKVLHRSGYTLVVAVLFGAMVQLITTGPFLISVLFTAVVVVLAVGAARSVESAKRAGIIMSLMMIVSALFPWILSIVSLPEWLSGSMMFPLERELFSHLTWETPILPYLTVGLYGGLLALTDQNKNTTQPWAAHAIMVGTLAIAVVAYINEVTLSHTVWTLAMVFIYPAFLFILRKNAPDEMSSICMMGRRITSIYFLHHAMMAAVCVGIVGVSFDYNTAYNFNSTGESLNSTIVIGTVVFIIFTSWLYAKIIESKKEKMVSEQPAS